jgi:hypothetical protein
MKCATLIEAGMQQPYEFVGTGPDGTAVYETGGGGSYEEALPRSAEDASLVDAQVAELDELDDAEFQAANDRRFAAFRISLVAWLESQHQHVEVMGNRVRVGIPCGLDEPQWASVTIGNAI